MAQDVRVELLKFEGERAIIQVFEGTDGLGKTNTKTKLLGHPMVLGVSKEILGRTFNGVGDPIDNLGPVYINKYEDVNGKPLNPVSREYPRNYINTGISAIDGLNTLIRGQKLPIFSGSGYHMISLLARLLDKRHLQDKMRKTSVSCLARMGVKNDVADTFRRSFEETGVMDKGMYVY